jgi:CRP/FNR family transcriptional regulator
MAQGLDKVALRELHCLVEHDGPYAPGEHVFRTGDRFNALYAVRSGTLKTSLVDDSGREQVLGFYLPGEMVGLNAIHPARYPCDAIALDTVHVCRFSFPALATLATRLPGVQQQLFRLLSEDIGKASLLAGDYSADERLAAFLVGLGERYAACDMSATALRLSMSRSDIASYLRLATETVSRVLHRLQDRKLIHVDGRDVTIIAPEQLNTLARNALHR